MKAEIKERWVKALRSGQYNQGRHALKTPGDTYCCLGVLCELAKEDGIGDWDGRRSFVVSERDYSSGSLPLGVQEWAETDLDPEVTHEGKIKSLSALNDEFKLSFDEIADLVEAQL